MPNKSTLTKEERREKYLKTSAENKIKRELAEKELQNAPTLVLTGKEKNGFDYWTAIRNALRPRGQYNLCKQLERAIVKTTIWTDVDAIEELLSTHFTLKNAN